MERTPINQIIGREFTFAYPKAFVTLPEYTAHAGQRVKVLRQLTRTEADRGRGLERMFKVQASDGWIGDAFESELEN